MKNGDDQLRGTLPVLCRASASGLHHVPNRSSLMTGQDGWSRRFEDPIELPDGTKLATLKQAVAYLARIVPKAEREHPAVTVAADHLIRAAEQNYPMLFARLATLQAIHRNSERVFNPDRKEHRWGKRKLKRDR